MTSAADAWKLSAPGGIEARVLAYGARLQSVVVPGRDGAVANVAVGFESPEDYRRYRSGRFGATIGRYANRIGGACFTLDGETYRLPSNDRGNCLHGGPHGFDTQLWTYVRGSERSVTLTYLSSAGEMGFPGALSIEVTYTVQGSDLRIDFRGSTDAPTVVNLTNHTCWNLAGSGSVRAHLLRLDASRYTPVDATGLPTGEVADIAGTPVDFRSARAVGEHDLDHNVVLDPAEGLRYAASLADTESGRALEVWTTEPCMQIWTGSEAAAPFERGSLVALETQHPPDSPNRPQFPSTTLRPGELFESSTVFRFGVV